MNLRLGRHLGTHVSDVASHATIRESKMRYQGNLESIGEGSTTDSHSDTFSQALSDMYHHPVDTNADTMHIG